MTISLTGTWGISAELSFFLRKIGNLSTGSAVPIKLGSGQAP
jgi:hypothetical protein